MCGEHRDISTKDKLNLTKVQGFIVYVYYFTFVSK